MKRTESNGATPLPTVSVIMPIRNEASFIAQALDAVLTQDYPRERTEILVVDGMSTDATRSIVESYQERFPNILLLDNPGKIVPKGMNIALSRATGEVISRVDGHCKIDPGYLRRCVDHLLHDGIDGVGGSVRTVGETGTARVIAAAMSSPFGVGGSAFRTLTDRTLLADTIPFPVYTRSIIQRAGPYDEELVRNQDDEYNYRLRKLGARLLLAADVSSEYFSRSSLRSLWRQYYQYGYWKVRVMQKHPRQMSIRQFVPAAFVLALACACIVLPFGPAAAWCAALIAGSYVAANLAAAAITAWKNRLGLAVALPVAYAILHLSYGTGFLAGLVEFRDRWGRDRSRVPGLAAAP